jgi:hypothetical protein
VTSRFSSLQLLNRELHQTANDAPAMHKTANRCACSGGPTANCLRDHGAAGPLIPVSAIRRRLQGICACQPLSDASSPSAVLAHGATQIRTCFRIRRFKWIDSKPLDRRAVASNHPLDGRGPILVLATLISPLARLTSTPSTDPDSDEPIRPPGWVHPRSQVSP